jgi:hypothetical protein
MNGDARSNIDDRSARFSGEKSSQVPYEKVCMLLFIQARH